jgi:S-adenosylmethionine:tRNA ribosyltransferase-isomerase
MNPKLISINDYTYNLPDHKIANYPLQNRDESKLLIWSDEIIEEDIYKNIVDHLPENSLLIFNNTKVIAARILFKKETGGTIEIFCLDPFEENAEYTTVMSKTGSAKWKCMIGGASKWKEGALHKKIKIKNEAVELTATLQQKFVDAYVAEFSWIPYQYTFSEIIENAGEVPLPPYIKRKAEKEDIQRYQTVYAFHHGSVAAPTAGLHFTERIFSSLQSKNIQHDFVTLHVGAGTFKPVKSEKMGEHEMHAECINVPAIAIENILNAPAEIVAVGTTSLRTIESLYWMGVKIVLNKNCALEDLEIKQWEVYDEPLSSANISKAISFECLLNWMKEKKLKNLFSKTQILIVPGYQFKIANTLVTNFHQPRSTLLLLVAAAIGNNWKNIYDYALENNFRFLSYGDGCLLNIMPSKEGTLAC